MTESFFCSWSGGKDSCLALYRAKKNLGTPSYLVTMFTETGDRSRSHGLPISLLEKQALSLGIPLISRSTSWDKYENVFTEVLQEIKAKGVDNGVFGDIDLEDHRLWVERVCTANGIKHHLPLWLGARRDLVMEFLNLGFKATIVATKEGILDKKYLGANLSEGLITEFEDLGIDSAGEEGEFHTVVTDGPIFSEPLKLTFKEQVLRDGYWFLDVNA